MSAFEVGDTIYVSKFGQKEVELDCPVCFRKGVVHLRLGNGDEVEMPCEYCNSGISTPPKGYVTEYRMDAGVETAIVTEVETRDSANGRSVEYRAGSYVYYAKDVFDSEEDALAESQRRAEAYNLERETKAEFVKGKPDKNYSWNAGYHKRLIKKAEADIEYHSKMAKICKAKGEPK